MWNRWGGFKAGNTCAKGGQAVGSQKDGKKQSSDSGKKSTGGAAVAETPPPPDAFLDGSAKFQRLWIPQQMPWVRPMVSGIAQRLSTASF